MSHCENSLKGGFEMGRITGVQKGILGVYIIAQISSGALGSRSLHQKCEQMPVQSTATPLAVVLKPWHKIPKTSSEPSISIQGTNDLL